MNEEINPADCHEADEIERAAEQVLKTAARGNDRPLRRDVTIEDIEDAVALVRLKDATRFAARKIRNQRNCINNLDARNKELNVRLDESKSNTFTEEDREMLAEIRTFAAQGAAQKRERFDAESKGGKKGAATRKAERTPDPTKTKITRFVKDKMREWDSAHPERKQTGYKGHYSNAQIYRDAERITANTSANGKPIYTADQIKEWFKPSKRKRTKK